MLTSEKSYTWVIVAAVLVAVGLAIYQVVLGGSTRSMPITINDESYQASVFSTDQERKRATQSADWTLDDSNLGLVVFKGVTTNSVEMPKTSAPRDFIWLDADKKIISVNEKVLPTHEVGKKYTANKDSKYLIIAPGGWIELHELRALHTVEFDAAVATKSGLPWS